MTTSRPGSGRTFRRRSRGSTLTALFACLAMATVATGAAVPAHAASYSVALTTSATSLETAYYATLTTLTNRDLTGTGYTTYLFDQTDPTWFRVCGTASCSFDVTQFTAGTHTYRAYVAKTTAEPTSPPQRIRARSDPVSITWSPSTFSVMLDADRTWLRPGATSTLTAAANKDVAGTAVRISLFDLTTGERLAECTAGSTCTASVSEPDETSHSYQAFVAESASTPPPPHVQASSAPVAVTWSMLPDPRRPPNLGGGDLGGTVSYRAPGVPGLSEDCLPTTFDIVASSVAAWVNGSGTAYAGPLSVSGNGEGVCETASTGAGILTLTASGTSAAGTLACPALLGTFTRVATDMTLVLNGDCTINAFSALRVGVLAKAHLVATPAVGSAPGSMTEVMLLGGFVVYPA